MTQDKFHQPCGQVPSPWTFLSFPAKPHCQLITTIHYTESARTGVQNYSTSARLKHHHYLLKARPFHCRYYTSQSIWWANIIQIYSTGTPSPCADPSQLHYFWGAKLLAIMYLSKRVSKAVCLQFPPQLVFLLQHPHTSESLHYKAATSSNKSAAEWICLYP